MLKRTPLHDAHVSIGARMIDFAGWQMPVQYSGPAQEHIAVRESAGLFDVSHMGEVEVRGPDAVRLLQAVTTNDVAKLTDNQAQYSVLTNVSGGLIDDLIVYRLNSEYFLLVVNAASADVDFEWISSHGKTLNVEVTNTSSGYALIALQGPRSEQILQDLTGHLLDRIPYYWSQRALLDGVDTRISRTGYTGEDGFEIFCDPNQALRLWNRLLILGGDRGLAPCGLAARNTLRLEAGFRLCGNDMDETTTPLEAGLGWVVKLDKGDFVGRDALVRQKETGLSRRLIGFEVLDRAPARDGYPIIVEGTEVSKVSSGSPAPFLKKNIGFAYLPIEHTAAGKEFFIVIRGRQVAARVTPLPFYKRERRFD